MSSKKYRKKVDSKIVGKKLVAVLWYNRPDVDNEIIGLKFEGGAVLKLYATSYGDPNYGNVVWGEVEDE